MIGTKFFVLDYTMQSAYNGLLFLSLVVLFHAAYSTAEWRSYNRRKSDQVSEVIPMDIVIQTLVGLILAMVAVLKVRKIIHGDYLEIILTILFLFRLQVALKKSEPMSN